MKARTPALLLASACLLSACTPPQNAAVTQCQGSYGERSCTLTVERFEKPTSATFKSSSSNLGVDIQASFTVRSGTALVQIHGSDGPAAQATVAPDRPADLTASTRLNRGSRSRDQDPFFTIQVIPSGVVEGLSGTVEYQTGPRG
jgi:hypothetical protein